jgi:hypothetical protein
MLKNVLNTLIALYTLYKLSTLFRAKLVAIAMYRKAQAKRRARDAVPLPSTLVDVRESKANVILSCYAYELA